MAKEANTFHPDSPANEYYHRGYNKGIKDADAVGFADWCDENYHKDNNTLWFNRYDNEPKGFSIEELYITYLKTKTK